MLCSARLISHVYLQECHVKQNWSLTKIKLICSRGLLSASIKKVRKWGVICSWQIHFGCYSFFTFLLVLLNSLGYFSPVGNWTSSSAVTPFPFLKTTTRYSLFQTFIAILICSWIPCVQTLVKCLWYFFLALLGVSGSVSSGVVYSSNWRAQDGLSETERLTYRSPVWM